MPSSSITSQSTAAVPEHAGPTLVLFYRNRDVTQEHAGRFATALIRRLRNAAAHYDAVHGALRESQLCAPLMRHCRLHEDTTVELINDFADVLFETLIAETTEAIHRVAATTLRALSAEPPQAHLSLRELRRLQDCDLGSRHIENYEEFIALSAHVSNCGHCGRALQTRGLY